ncbi:MAG: ABC transporter permease [Planctomycetota bacterium]|jgi:putative ABC transport system permease protein|nr:ABC transporter permease [Planctomycetota bacterium]
MFFRIIRGGIVRQRRKLLLIAITVMLGVSLATAMLNVMLDVGDKINQELKTYGANLNVVPRGASFLGDLYGLEDGAGVSDKYLAEDELGRLKTIFWAYNIVDFTPYLEAPARAGDKDFAFAAVGTWFAKTLDLPTGEKVTTGMRGLKSWWSMDGEWPDDARNDQAVLGYVLARRLGLKKGDTLGYSGPDGKPAAATVTGVFNSGSAEDDLAYLPLAAVQGMTGLDGLVRRVEVSALTTPENDLARRAARSPASLSAKEWETWYCTAYIGAIAYQIEEVLTDARAKPILQVAESEGAILGKIELLMALLTALGMACSALALSNLVTASVLERSTEIGLLKAIGATDLDVLLLILAEILLTAVAGAGAGYSLGLWFSRIIGQAVFNAAISVSPTAVPLVAAMVVFVTVLGCVPAIKLLLSLRPTQVLHGR